MPRYNTSLATGTINGNATISSPFQGAFTQLTGTGGYTVTLPNPGLYPGSNQTFYNGTSPAGVVTLTTPSGIFTGTGGPGATTYTVSVGNVVSVTSDGTNYIVISEDGSPLTATTGSFTSDVSISAGTTTITPAAFTLAPSVSGTLNNVSIGASTRSTGAFTSLAANQQTTLSANIASSSTTTGTLVVTGGIGASGNINASAVVATNLTGTLQTASQPNITTVGALTSLTVDTNTLYVDTTSKRIGIGTTSANAKVDITMAGSTASPTTMVVTTGSPAGVPVGPSSIVLYNAINGGNTDSTVGIFGAQAGTSGLASGIGFSRQSSGDWGTQIRFYTHPTSTSVYDTIVERARIDAGGSWTVGATSRGYGASLGYMAGFQSGGSQTFISIAKSGQTLDTDGMIIGMDTTGGSIYVRPNQPLDFYTNNTLNLRLAANGNLSLGIGSATAEGRLHVQQTAITAAAPNLGWPNYVQPDQDTNARIVAVFDTAGNGSIATAGQGGFPVLRIGSYYDSRGLITMIGAGGASPSDQGTSFGKDLMVKAGTSDNANGARGGRLFLNGGAGFTSGSGYGAAGYFGNVQIQGNGGNTYIGRNDQYAAGYNNLYLPFKYNDGGEWVPQKGIGWLHLGSFTHRAGNRYLDIKTNNNSGSLMFMFWIYGYLYNSANINTYIGGYSYTGSSILNNYVQNLANCTATTYRTSTNNYLCLKIDRNNNGYSEGKVNVFFHAWNASEMDSMVVTSYAQNDSASQYYTS